LQQSLDAAQTTGFLSGDQIAVSGLATGTAPGLYNSNLAVTGADARNYSVRYQNATLEILPITSSLNLLKATENSSFMPQTRIAYRGFSATGAAVGGKSAALVEPSCSPDRGNHCECELNIELSLEICLPAKESNR
jgi:hypothetical protein